MVHHTPTAVLFLPEEEEAVFAVRGNNDTESVNAMRVLDALAEAARTGRTVPAGIDP